MEPLAYFLAVENNILRTQIAMLTLQNQELQINLENTESAFNDTIRTNAELHAEIETLNDNGDWMMRDFNALRSHATRLEMRLIQTRRQVPIPEQRLLPIRLLFPDSGSDSDNQVEEVDLTAEADFSFLNNE